MVESTIAPLCLHAPALLVMQPPAGGGPATNGDSAGSIARERETPAVSLTWGPPWPMVGRLAIADAAGSRPTDTRGGMKP